jgi:hypothetical protein
MPMIESKYLIKTAVFINSTRLLIEIVLKSEIKNSTFIIYKFCLPEATTSAMVK